METLAKVAIVVGIIAYADVQLTQISLWPLYMAPVALAAWELGFLGGLLVAGAAALLLLAVGYTSGYPYSDVSFFLLATASQVTALVVIAWLTSRLALMEAVLTKLFLRHRS